MTTLEYRPRKYLSVSTIMDFARCPMRYYYKKCGLRTPDTSPALLYGTAMHKAVPDAIEGNLDAAMSAFLSVWDEKLADERRSTARARAQLANMVESHRNSLIKFVDPPPGTLVRDDKTNRYEVPAVLDIGLRVPLVVRIDGLVRHRDTGELWGYEFKTTSRLTTTLFENLEFHPQILVYVMALQTLSGETVRGMMAEAMLIDAKREQTMLCPIYVGHHLISEAVKWLQFHGGLLLDCEERGVWPRNFAGCSGYSHFYIPTSTCEYANLCRVENPESLYDTFVVDEEHDFLME